MFLCPIPRHIRPLFTIEIPITLVLDAKYVTPYELFYLVSSVLHALKIIFFEQPLEKSYSLKISDYAVERPQHMLMRVAVGIHGGDIIDARSRRFYSKVSFVGVLLRYSHEK